MQEFIAGEGEEGGRETGAFPPFKSAQVLQ